MMHTREDFQLIGESILDNPKLARGIQIRVCDSILFVATYSEIINFWMQANEQYKLTANQESIGLAELGS